MRLPAVALIFLNFLGCSFGCNGSVGCSGLTGRPPSTSSRSSVHDMEQKTVALAKVDGKSVDVYCAGVWVSPSVVLTAKHCAVMAVNTSGAWFMHYHDYSFPLKEPAIGTAIDIIVRNGYREDPSTLHGKLALLDDKNDLALVKIRNSGDHPWVSIASYDPQSGDPIFVEGHPNGMAWSYEQGYVAAERTQLSGPDSRVADVMQAMVPGFYFGNSGGPAFDSDGDLVGIGIYINDAPSTGFFAPPHVIREFLYP